MEHLTHSPWHLGIPQPRVAAEKSCALSGRLPMENGSDCMQSDEGSTTPS